MTDNRSERLRQRRKQSTQTPDEDADDEPSSTSSRQDDPSEQPGSTDSDESGEETHSVKEEQIGTYMYLPESQTKELRRQYNILKAEYEFEYDAEFEKNRHFYPLVIQYGLESLEGITASEIQTRLEEI
jgi:hypothetical protein